MKKLLLLVLALALLIPMNAYAYTTFIAADQSVADELDLVGFNLIDSGLGILSATWNILGTSTYQFDANPSISAVGVSSPLPFALYNVGTGHGFTWSSGAIASPGLLLSYSEASGSTAPTLYSTLVLPGPVIDFSKYQLDLTYDFTGYTIDGGTLINEAGALYTLSQVPIPGAVFLLGSGLIGLVGLRKKLS